MKIKDQIAGELSRLNAKKTTDRTDSSKSRLKRPDAQGDNDQVKVSSLNRQIGTFRVVLDDMPDPVAELRGQIERGEYSREPSAVADAIVNRVLQQRK